MCSFQEQFDSLFHDRINDNKIIVWYTFQLSITK